MPGGSRAITFRAGRPRRMSRPSGAVDALYSVHRDARRRVPTNRRRPRRRVRRDGRTGRGSVRCQADRLGNRFVRGAFPLGTGVGQIEPAADQRRQFAAASVGEPILLIANRTRGVDVQRDTRFACQAANAAGTSSKNSPCNAPLRKPSAQTRPCAVFNGAALTSESSHSTEDFRHFGRTGVGLCPPIHGFARSPDPRRRRRCRPATGARCAGVAVETLTHRTGRAGGALDVDDDRCDHVATS